MTVVVPDAVAARQLRHRYAVWRAGPRSAVAGAVARVWSTPKILGWDAWLLRLQESLLWEGVLGFPGEFIDGFREELVWEQVISGALPDGAADAAGLARLAREAWRLLHDHAAAETFAEAGTRHLGEARHFRRWSDAYAALLREQRWVDGARARRGLLEAAGAARFDGERVLLFGFDTLLPAQRLLLRRLTSRGLALRAARPRTPTPRPRRRAFADEAAQYQALGDWVRDALLEDAGSAVAIALVQPASPSDPVGRALARTLDAALLPAALLPDKSGLPRPWCFAHQGSLAEQPLARSALRLMELTLPRLPAAAFSVLMHDPNLAEGHEELSARALFDVWLRDHGWRDVEVALLPALLRQYGRRGRRPRQLERSLDRVQRALGTGGAAGADAWAERYRLVLSAFGWPGPRGLDAAELQQVENVLECLGRFAGIAHLLHSLSAEQALGRLRRLFASTSFRAEAADVPVLVTSLRSALALDLDHLWVPGLDADRWPPPARPHPLLGAAFCERIGMTGASARGQRRAAVRQTRRLAMLAPSVVLSHAGAAGGERPRPASALTRELPRSPMQEAPARIAPRLPVAAAALERVRDDLAPPPGGHGAGARRPSDASAANAGAAAERPARARADVLGLQALCPFRAFAEARLGATALPRPAAAAARRRRVLLHEALVTLWDVLRDADSLIRTIDSGALDGLVREHLSHARAALLQRGFAGPGPAAARVELDCLTRTLCDWLALEARRPRFRVVAVAQAVTLSLAGMQLALRIDRVDEVAGIGEVVIDYRAGTGVPRGGWRGWRPDAPEPVLCALALDPPPAAVATAFLATDRQGFRGLGADAAALPGIDAIGRDGRPTAAVHDAVQAWQAQLDRWREVMQRLAAAFAGGEAHVAPLDGSATCRTCALPALCRIADHDTGGGA